MSNYLLDVNVLVAHAVLEHNHHDPVTERLHAAASRGSIYHTCPIVELGLMRNIMRIGSLNILEARQLLKNERSNLNLQFVPDDLSADCLPKWIQGYRQTTNAYLSTLAQKHGLLLLTIDKNIAGAVDLFSL